MTSDDVPGPRWWERLNRGLFPWMGPAQLGPYGAPDTVASAAKPCPLCGAAMSAHTVERPGHNVASRLRCP